MTLMAVLGTPRTVLFRTIHYLQDERREKFFPAGSEIFTRSTSIVPDDDQIYFGAQSLCERVELISLS